MASREAAKKGAQEAIFVNEKGYITEGASSGLYFVFKNKVYTTPLAANILPSVTRKYIVKAWLF
jgi:branched-subunit amino acid aminotransferase/4-amino-4-deoxychorismate lyase